MEIEAFTELIPGDLDAKSLSELPQISEVILRSQRAFKIRDHSSRGAVTDDEIINVDGNHGLTTRVIPANIQTGFVATALEALRQEVLVQLQVPQARALLEAVQRLVKFPDLVRVLRILKTRRLADIDITVDITIVEKCSTDIEGVNSIALLVGRDRKQQAKASCVNHGAVGLGEINTILLRVALGNKPGLVFD